MGNPLEYRGNGEQECACRSLLTEMRTRFSGARSEMCLTWSRRGGTIVLPMERKCGISEVVFGRTEPCVSNLEHKWEPCPVWSE